jgi:tetratricopeptide (TPR) repeat protein/predicted Ser/Thr protein kinase
MDDQRRPGLGDTGKQGGSAGKVPSGLGRSVSNAVNPSEGSGDSPTLIPPSSSDPSDSPTLVDGLPPAPPVRRAPPRAQEFQAPQPALKEGTVLVERYEIVKTLGEGGMGAVYKAKDLALDRMVALKVIRPELAQNPSIIDRFKQELLLSQRVTHRNVIRIYDLGEGDGMQFITMEFIEGRDLRTIIHERRKLPPEEAVGIMEQICLALDSAHSVDVIHRDLKPQNIMIDRSGRVLVMDFGLARTVEGDGMTQTGAMVGTMEYMSPEQALAQDLDQRSDLFSVGLIFYEMLTGQMPFRADSALASLIRRTQERALPISSHDASFPQNLIYIVSRCLERDPAARYQTAKELLADLEAWDGKRAAGAVAFQSVQPWGQDIPWSKIGVGVAALILAVLGFLLRDKLFAPTAAHAPVSVLVADFQNKTSDTLFDGTLEQGFNVALEGASFITAYSRGDAHKTAAELKPETHEMDESLARLVAQREGVSVVVSGAIEKGDKGYRISAKAVDTISGKTLAKEATSVQNKDEVLQSIGTLAAGIRKKLGDVTPESAQLLQTATYSSSSLEATHEYVQGQQLQNSGKWEEAISHYQRALQLDPNMARAYAATGAAKFNLGRMDEAEQNYQQAMSHIDRMSDREKYRTRAEYFLVKHEPREAIQEYTKLEQQFPGDTSVHTNLSFAYFLLRNMPMALEEARKSLEYSGKSSLERNNLAIASMYAGDFAGAEKEARTVMQQDPSYLSPYSTMAAAQIGQGRFDEAKQTYEKQAAISARGSSLAKLGLSDLALFQGRADEAIATLRSGIEDDLKNKDPGAGAAKSISLAQAELLAGQRAAALAATDTAVSLDKGPSVLHAAGGIYAQAGEFKKADALVDQLKVSIDPDPQLYAKLLEAEIALNRKDVKTAVSVLKDAQNLADSWLGHLLLGRAYLEAGAFPEADSEIETCIKRKGEASAVYLDEAPTFRLFPPVYYYLGRVQEGLKSPAYAESYKTLLLVQEKGTGPLLSDARRRVANH